MFRLAKVVLFHVFKRLSANLASRRGEQFDDVFEPNLQAQDGPSSWWVKTLIGALMIYIVVALGFYAKVHLWDSLTEAQKAVVVQSMQVNPQML